MTQTIAIVSFKGGAGKSSVTAGLAGELVKRGLRVLAVDADPQGGLTAALGLGACPNHETEGGPPASTWNLLGGRPLEQCLVNRHGIDLVPTDMRLAGAELATSSGWQDALRDRLVGEASGWDYVLIDSAPGLGVLPFIAIRAATQALIVCPQDFMSVRVIPHVLATCQRAQTPVLGLVPTMTGARTRHELEAGLALINDFPGLLLPEIPRRVAVQDAALAGQPIQLYAPSSDAAVAFARLTERIIEDGA